MPEATEPPDSVLRQILSHFSAGKLNREQACRKIGAVFGRAGDDLDRHIGILLDDIRRHRITADEARRDLSRAAAAVRKGDPNFLVFLAPEHA